MDISGCWGGLLPECPKGAGSVAATVPEVSVAAADRQLLMVEDKARSGLLKWLLSPNKLIALTGDCTLSHNRDQL